MKIISPAASGLLKAWGSPQNTGCRSRKIRYLLEAPCADGTLVYNTVTGEMILLTPEETSLWNQLPGVPDEALSELVARHYIVPENYEDAKAVSQLRTLLRALDRSKNITNYTILPTTGCNARCFYCYENGFPVHSLSSETAESIVRYILGHCGGSKVYIQWFGGEPLVGHPRISQICSRLREEGISFSSTMISNAFLFDEEIVRRASCDWHLKKVQITLDGTEDIYNRTKAYVGVTGSPYRRVLSNISLLLHAGIRVLIRLNLDSHNADDLTSLVDELANLFQNEENLLCHAHLLYENEGSSPVAHSANERRQLVLRGIALNRYIVEKGLRLAEVSKNLPSLYIRYCMADAPSAVLINPLGEIGKCDRHLFDRLVGKLPEGVTDTIAWKNWLASRPSPSCEACSLYPFCARPSYCPNLEPCLPELREYKKDIRIRQMQSLYANAL